MRVAGHQNKKRLGNDMRRTPEQEEAWKRYEEDTRTRRGLETI